MNGVIGMTNLLMGTNLTTQQLEYVKVVQASGNTLMYAPILCYFFRQFIRLLLDDHCLRSQ